MGERAVRSIAASTSASTDASVPSTTWRTIGSTAAALTTPEHQVGQPVDLDREARLHDGGRAVLLDDHRAISAKPCRQVVASVDHEARPPADGAAAASGRRRLQPRTVDAAKPGDLPVHELQHLSTP